MVLTNNSKSLVIEFLLFALNCRVIGYFPASVGVPASLPFWNVTPAGSLPFTSSHLKAAFVLQANEYSVGCPISKSGFGPIQNSIGGMNCALGLTYTISPFTFPPLEQTSSIALL